MRPRRRRLRKGYLRFVRKNRKFIESFSNHIRGLCCNFAYIPEYSDTGERVLTVIISADGMNESRYTISDASIIKALDDVVINNDEPTVYDKMAKAYTALISR